MIMISIWSLRTLVQCGSRQYKGRITKGESLPIKTGLDGYTGKISDNVVDVTTIMGMESTTKVVKEFLPMC